MMSEAKKPAAAAPKPAVKAAAKSEVKPVAAKPAAKAAAKPAAAKPAAAKAPVKKAAPAKKAAPVKKPTAKAAAKPVAKKAAPSKVAAKKPAPKVAPKAAPKAAAKPAKPAAPKAAEKALPLDEFFNGMTETFEKARSRSTAAFDSASLVGRETDSFIRGRLSDQAELLNDIRNADEITAVFSAQQAYVQKSMTDYMDFFTTVGNACREATEKMISR